MVTRERAERVVEDGVAALPLHRRRDHDFPVLFHPAELRDEEIDVLGELGSRHGDVVAVPQNREQVRRFLRAHRAPEPLERAGSDRVGRHDDGVALERVDDLLAELARVLGVANAIERRLSALRPDDVGLAASTARPRASWLTPSSSTKLPKQSSGRENRITHAPSRPSSLFENDATRPMRVDSASSMM